MLPAPDKLQKTTKQSQKRIAQEQEAKEKERLAKLEANTKMELNHWRKYLEKDMAKAAHEGRSQVSLSPMGGVSEAGGRAFRILAQELKEQGYKTEIRTGHYSPIGSDDLPSHDWTELRVSWESK